MCFRDRADAGRKLATALAHYESENPIILALPRGGVPVAAEVAVALNAPLDILLVRKIASAIQPDLALGAVVDGGEPIIVRNPNVIESTATNEEEFEALCKRELEEIERQRGQYLGERIGLSPEGRVVIVVDDAVMTGATMRAALQATRARKPKKLVLAVPVSMAESFKKLRSVADEAICLTALAPVDGVRGFYDDFKELTDGEVVGSLAKCFDSRHGKVPRAAIDSESLRRVAGDLEPIKAAEILALEPNEGELEEAVIWAAGNGDLQAKAGRPLDGKAAKIFDIITADEEDERL
jgi:predicted phosphoribosyltransferase